MISHSNVVLEKYQAYFLQTLEAGLDPMFYEDWYETVLLPYLTGLNTRTSTN
jgi:hypothetical protein